nr:MAG TPA: hypothetical protein [Caudoviricetes sp.]
MFLKIIWHLMRTAIACMLAFDFFALVFIAIKNTTGYCNPLMDKVINISIKSAKRTKEEALWLYDN